MAPESGLLKLGRSAWAFVGIVMAGVVVYLSLAFLSGLVVPLVIASVLGILMGPVVDILDRYLPRPAATGLVMLGLGALVYGTVAITIEGILDQGPEIRSQISAGLEAFAGWLADMGFGDGDVDSLLQSIEEMLASLMPGLTSILGSAFSSVAAFAIGTFVALFFLYFILDDWTELTEWVGSHLGVAPDLGAGMVEDTVWSMRKYFYVLTGSALVTAVVIGAAMAFLGLPLAFTVAFVTFITSYIPYLGAILSGAFAFLIALGSGGLSEAFVVLLVILVAQNVIQPIIQTKFTEGALRLHPVVSFGSTIVGTALAGVLGAMLSSPVVAMLISIDKRLRESRSASPGPGSGADGVHLG